jgi:hypothetical protein
MVPDNEPQIPSKSHFRGTNVLFYEFCIYTPPSLAIYIIRLRINSITTRNACPTPRQGGDSLNRTQLRLIGLVSALFLTITTSLVWSTTSAQRPDKIKVDLPTRPAAHELHPEVYDSNGCLKDPEGPKCGAKGDGKMEEPDSPAKPKSLKGFVGPYYASEISGDRLEVLPDSLTVSTSGQWQVRGLVRNELPHSVGDVTVTATLLSASGVVLERVTTNVPVSLLRPGEPGPFSAQSSVDAALVGSIQWSVEYGPPRSSAARDLLIYRDWQIPFGVEEYRGTKREGPHLPFVMAVSFENVGPNLPKVEDVELVVAWLDDTGRVVWVATSSLHERSSRNIPVRGTGFFNLVSVDDPIVGPSLHSLNYMYWVVAK